MSFYTHIEIYLYMHVSLEITEWRKPQEKNGVANISAMKEKKKKKKYWNVNLTAQKMRDSKSKDKL